MNLSRIGRAMSLVLCLAVIAGTGLHAQNISLTVDATKTRQKLLHVRLEMPVKPGPLTVYYPKWIPGEHGPDGPIASLTGLKFEGNGKAIPWQRDLLDTFTFHVNVPDGVSQLDATYDFIEPTEQLSNRQADGAGVEQRCALSRGNAC